MAISFSRYVNIVSGVGGNPQVKERDLILRIFTTNLTALAPDTYVEYLPSQLPQIGAAFGMNSEEYLSAVAYFGFVSKQITSPDKISFASYNSGTTKPRAYGDPNATGTVAQFIAGQSNPLEITIGSVAATLTGLNFSSDATLDAVAATIQTALVAVAGLSGSTVIYNDPTGQFIIAGPTGGSAAGTISFPNTNPVLETLMGMKSVNTIISPGQNAEQPVQALTTSIAQSTNFATFKFTQNANVTLTQAENIAAWLATENNQYMFLLQTSAANAAAWSAALIGYEGVALTLCTSTDWPEILPGKVAASTDYTKRNVSQNYEFQEDSSLVPSVADDADANTYDNLRVNYYGQTQINGQLIDFYQTGVLMGGANAPTDMGIYVNEIWLKGQIAVAFINALLALPQIPANAAGRAIGISIIQSVIGQALFNGVISTAEQLSETQIEYIINATGSSTVANQIATIGYWFTVTFTSTVLTNGTTQWSLNYQLLYAKNNVVRVVNGSDVLI